MRTPCWRILAGRARFAVQENPAGTGNALAAAEGAIDPSIGNVLVMNGDAPLIPASAIARLMAAHDESGARMTMLTVENPVQPGLGRINRGEDGCVAAIVEERDTTPEQLAVTEVNGGVYALAHRWPLGRAHPHCRTRPTASCT